MPPCGSTKQGKYATPTILNQVRYATPTWLCQGGENPPPSPGCCSFTGPWTVTRSSLRMLRRVAAFCRPLRPVLLLVSFPRSMEPSSWCAGAVLDVAWCAVCTSAAPNNWRIEDVLVVAGVPPRLLLTNMSRMPLSPSFRKFGRYTNPTWLCQIA